MSSWFFRAAALVALSVLLAPTPGDIGGCGETARDLDPPAFFASKQVIECEKCRACGLSTPACGRACDREEVPDEFPPGCYPLVHDGTVCLRALTQASCADHRKVVAEPPSVPTECNFCPP